MASLKEKLEKALADSASGIIDPVVELEQTSSCKVGGLVISNTFLDMDQLDRQNKIWNYLERVLQQEELLNIVSLITVTPDEADIDN
jgi:acid stress-induced BolA-like protein IbaG/YrbA